MANKRTPERGDKKPNSSSSRSSPGNTVRTDPEVKANWPDIIAKQRDGPCPLIDVSIPMNCNVVQKEAEKRLKHKSLELEIGVQRMWRCKTKTVPVVEGATGVISNASAGFIKGIPGRISIASIQKTAVLGTAAILRKVLT
ncbi:hypothetical protein BC332_34869 [Capsicum chinense]|nr:hypothetical protein BC332_34869 [Capsicum chinense]